MQKKSNCKAAASAVGFFLDFFLSIMLDDYFIRLSTFL